MAKNNVQSVSYLLCMQVTKAQIIPNHQISPDTNLHKTYQKIKHNIFEELVPSVSPLLKKAHKARTHWYHGPFCQFINTRFLIKRNGQKQ